MEHVHGVPSDRTEGQLSGVVRGVRARWRLKHALHGSTIAVILGFVIVSACAYALKALHYGDGAVLTLRIAVALAILGLVYRFVVRAMVARPRDEQVALYVEEHESSLGGALVTAVEVESGVREATIRSPALAAKLVRSAVDGVKRVGDGARVDAAGLQRTSATLAAVVAAAAFLALFGPQSLRHGARLLLAPWQDAQAAAGVFAIKVTPGNAAVARGGDQLVTATLRGFQSDRVDLLVRAADSTEWRRVAMPADSGGRFAFRLFDVTKRTEYAVEASGVRSPVYHLDVTNLPYVKRVDLEYRFPAYTQLPPQRVDSTGDIAALKGTMVRVRVTPTIATAGGRVIVDGNDTLQLAPTAAGALIAMVRVEHSGFYKVELQGPDGRMVTGSLDYTIDALNDRPPTVKISKPGRDAKVLAVDEVFTEAHAEDDYGVAKLDLVYSVNGGPEKTVPLSAATTRVLRDISAGYTFMLEDDHLSPGDVVSYYARATDNNAVSGAQSARSDLFFLNVRRYD
ncbi:MAG: DUF4175 family protein, partial [Gemmatimonadales bacterium]